MCEPQSIQFTHTSDPSVTTSVHLHHHVSVVLHRAHVTFYPELVPLGDSVRVGWGGGEVLEV